MAKDRDKGEKELTAPFYGVLMVARQYIGTFQTEADAKEYAARNVRKHTDCDVYVFETAYRAIDPTPPWFEDASK